MISLFGYGKTTKAIADRVKDCKIYDDSVDNVVKKDGYTIYPSSYFDQDESLLQIPSPGIPPHNPLIKKAKNLVSDYDYFLAKSKALNIWISGTNGKTTTTKMLANLLEEKNAVMGGNVGIPVASLLPASIYVLETSSFTLHYTNIAKPDIYILLPISEDHIDWHGDFDEYKKAKLKPLKFMREGEAVLLPYEFRDEPTDGYKIAYKNSKDLANFFDIDVDKINFKEPFLLDAVLALSVCKIIFDEIDYDKINSFVLDPHRVEEIRDKRSRLWVNDSKGTNIDATIQAIKRYKDKKIYLILGGDDKGADLSRLFKLLKELDVQIYATGSNKYKIDKLSRKIDKEVTIYNSLDDIVKDIDKKLSVNDVALLSPAASSLDEYNSYKQRGDLFKGLVSQI